MSAISAFALILHIVFLSKTVRRLYARLFYQNLPSVDEPSSERSQSLNVGFFIEAKEHIAKHGGFVIYAHQVVRLACCLALLGLSLATLILTKSKLSHVNQIGASKRWGHKIKHRHNHTTENEYLQIFSVVNFVRLDLRRFFYLILIRLLGILLVTGDSHCLCAADLE
jgi:hypothetical protein